MSHWQPVWFWYRIVFRTSRTSVGPRPDFATARGIRSPTNSHCWSVKSVLYLFRFWPVPFCSDTIFSSYLPHAEQFMTRNLLRIACETTLARLQELAGWAGISIPEALDRAI